ncbi:hypothetical protein BDV95DRAFT_268647 [Massariosphaeria phaeospora]|uniref:Uncharacterized protein n=1 Tax=Massariosphaeria phaeospora TaxID=100035 RepID=A0A7C8MEC8_9PLEO|nr:hypothetical protein BDV95DRAFT_268647 [Massariosphaeria phaeospora]
MAGSVLLWSYRRFRRYLQGSVPQCPARPPKLASATKFPPGMESVRGCSRERIRIAECHPEPQHIPCRPLFESQLLRHTPAGQGSPPHINQHCKCLRPYYSQGLATVYSGIVEPTPGLHLQADDKLLCGLVHASFASRSMHCSDPLHVDAACVSQRRLSSLGQITLGGASCST